MKNIRIAVFRFCILLIKSASEALRCALEAFLAPKEAL